MIHSSEPRIGVAGDESYAPFEPRVAFNYFSEAPAAAPVQVDPSRQVYFEAVPQVVDTPAPDAASPAQFADTDTSGRVPLSEYQWTGPGRHEPARRALDQTVAFLLLLGVAPLLGVVALTLRLLDRSPILVRDRRIGRFGREIDLLSFRSLPHGNPQMAQFGRFIRQSGITVLPRLLNVLRGDLTLVGPKPITQGELPRYGLDVIHYLSGRPGLTGIWQSPSVAKLPLAARCQLERSYARARSLKADLTGLLQMLTSSDKSGRTAP